MTAERFPASGLPTNNQFFFPTALGLMSFSVSLLCKRGP
jgi:hypothetical protein